MTDPSDFPLRSRIAIGSAANSLDVFGKRKRIPRRFVAFVAFDVFKNKNKRNGFQKFAFSPERSNFDVAKSVPILIALRFFFKRRDKKTPRFEKMFDLPKETEKKESFERTRDEKRRLKTRRKEVETRNRSRFSNR